MPGDALTAVDVIDWPQHIGVEGLSLRAARASGGPVSASGSASRALAALRAWLPDLADPGPPDGRDRGANRRPTPTRLRALHPDQFPCTEVLAHFQAAGRTHADAELVDRLRAVGQLVRQGSPAARRRLWPLPDWLPSTVDQLDGDYDSYLVSRLLESATEPGRDAADREAETSRLTDALLATLVTDLALTEADALRRGRRGRPQRKRTQACLLVLSRVADLAPAWPQLAGVDFEPASGSADRSDEVWLADYTTELALSVRAMAPRPVRLATELAMLPTTRLHDEQMFIRSVQIFETLYRQVYRCLRRAGTAVQRLDVDLACAELADATARLNLSPVLYRVVTTTPKDAFAIIRQYTNGRSAIQSRSYRQIELACAPRTLVAMADKLPPVRVQRPSLEEAFLASTGRLAATDADRLAAAMRGLDASWRAMKRTHWGITLKIIGRVSGTGGTAGAAYLEQATRLPLFPRLSATAGAEPARVAR